MELHRRDTLRRKTDLGPCPVSWKLPSIGLRLLIPEGLSSSNPHPKRRSVWTSSLRGERERRTRLCFRIRRSPTGLLRCLGPRVGSLRPCEARPPPHLRSVGITRNPRGGIFLIMPRALSSSLRLTTLIPRGNPSFTTMKLRRKPLHTTERFRRKPHLTTARHRSNPRLTTARFPRNPRLTTARLRSNHRLTTARLRSNPRLTTAKLRSNPRLTTRKPCTSSCLATGAPRGSPLPSWGAPGRRRPWRPAGQTAAVPSAPTNRQPRRKPTAGVAATTSRPTSRRQRPSDEGLAFPLDLSPRASCASLSLAAWRAGGRADHCLSATCPSAACPGLRRNPPVVLLLLLLCRRRCWPVSPARLVQLLGLRW